MKTIFNKHLKFLNNQSGYASFVITFVTMIVVSLIVVAFATDSRIEQKDSLSNNLATQAYYAAESGINDAFSVVAADIKAGATIDPTTSNKCLDATPGIGKQAYYKTSFGTGSNELNGSNVEYTCLVVNPSPNTVLGQNVVPGQGKVFPIDTSPTNIASMTIGWQESGTGMQSFGSCPPNSTAPNAPLQNYATYTANCSAGILQVDLLTANDLTNELKVGSNPFSSNATTVFLVPTSGAATAIGSLTNNEVIYTKCVAGTPACSATFNLPVNPPASSVYYLHIQSFYMTNNVSIEAFDGANGGGNQLAISGDQVQIDATGEAAGQLKRLDERVCDNLYCNSLTPDNAIQSDQCINKDFSVYPLDPNTDPAASSC